MTDNPCTMFDDVPEHDQLVRVARLPSAHLEAGKFGLVYPCAIPGISLTDYSKSPAGKGWGAACSGPFTTITLANGRRLTVHSRIAELVTLIMNANLAEGYDYDASTGAYNCRYISGTHIWSNHAWGLAVDESWDRNPQRSPVTTDRPAWEQARWQRYGFALGLNYVPPSIPDAMHNEFMGTPDQADAATALARDELGGDRPVPPPPAPPAPSPSDQVRRDQFDLHDTGFDPGPQDGVWGPSSAAACRRFQAAARIAVDGICGDDTRRHLHMVPSWHTAPDAPGDGGYSALVWQQRLRAHGWHIGTDGVWGAHSTSILRQFQADKGLAVDGIRGPASWTCLYCTVN